MRDHFLSMMDKYDLSYRVDSEGGEAVSLIVERLSWNPPSYEQAWQDSVKPNGTSEIKVLYQLNTTPPGIPTWFIARSHRFTTRTHWRTGAVLRHTDGLHTALVVANPHRNSAELTVRGPTPAAFFSILDDGFRRTLERYPGLTIKRLVPCPCHKEEQSACAELYDYEDLQHRLTLDPPRYEIECRKSGEMLPVPLLLLGLAPSERDATRASIERLTSAIADIDGKLANQAEYTQRMFLKIQRIIQDQQEVRCPSIFTVLVADRRIAGSTFEIRLYCEEPGGWHPLPGKDGRYAIREPAAWLRKISPYLKHLLAVLQHAAPLAGPVLGMAVSKLNERVQDELEAMKELIAQIPEPARPVDYAEKGGQAAPVPEPHASNEADFRALEALLVKLDPDRRWGGLSRTTTPEGLTLYLCQEHSQAYSRTARL
jgi:hypothetical protein